MEMEFEHLDEDVLFEIFVDVDFGGILLFEYGFVELFGYFD
jgi:hypothetical protein